MPHMSNLPWLEMILLSLMFSLYMNNNLIPFLSTNPNYLKTSSKLNFMKKW